MKYIIFSFLALFGNINIVLAWDGFDADSADLVEILPDLVPHPGQQIEVRNYDTDKSLNGVVKSVTRNSRTIEIVYIDQDGKPHTLVMEGRQD